jgi:hypothetical protein
MVGGLPPAFQRVLGPETAERYLTQVLQSQLYRDFYCQGGATSDGTRSPRRRVAATAPFVEALSAANTGHGYWEDGWEVRAVQGAEALLCRGGVELRAKPGEYRLPVRVPLAPGVGVSLRLPKERLNLSPGFYVAMGDTADPTPLSHPLVRLYWHLAPAGAVPFVSLVTSALNRAGVPFTLKVLSDSDRFDRRDAGVVYVGRSWLPVVTPLLAEVYDTLAPFVRPGVPALTKVLVPGLALAEDPGNGASFGMHRCRLLAEAMVRARALGERSAAGRLRIAAERFSEEGLDLARPYLGAGSSDGYRWPLAGAARRVTSTDMPSSRSTWLEMAVAVGERLLEDAIWYGERCNWVGAVPAHPPLPSAAVLTYRPLGSDLYSGTSGVALFFAELHAATGEAPWRRGALGALRQTLARLDTVPPRDRLGLYGGWPGVALATARAGALLGDEGLVRHAARILVGSLRRVPERPGFDLQSGLAGAIAVLVALDGRLAGASLLDDAARLGDALLSMAHEKREGFYWKSDRSKTRLGPTGFLYGAAGAGYALTELAHATGDARFKEGALRAFAYERQWLDPARGDWADLRDVSYPSRHRAPAMPCVTFWCHGAAGIALSRLRAYELLQDAACRQEAAVAVGTTHCAIMAGLDAGIGSGSLCHGLAGNAEVLRYGEEVLGGEENGSGTLLCRVGRATAARMEEANGSELGGPPEGVLPGLLPGLGGIGRFCLRLYDPTIPSILILRREEGWLPIPA